MMQYDVTDPFNPKLAGTVKIGGIVRSAPHPSAPDHPRTEVRRWYEKVGRRMPRAWVNLDVIWAAALILTAILTPFV